MINTYNFYNNQKLVMCCYIVIAERIGLHHTLDGITNPKYSCCISLQLNFLQKEEGTGV
jgi:hypothetical protein